MEREIDGGGMKGEIYRGNDAGREMKGEIDRWRGV